MARIRIEYKKYSISKLATCVSFLGGLFSTLLLYPAIALFAISLIGLFTNGITKAESWATLGGSVLLCLVCFGISLGAHFVFDFLAEKIARSKLNRILKKNQIR